MKTASKETVPNFDRFSFRLDLFKLLLIVLVYFLAQAISFFFPDSNTLLMLIWPAGGIGFAAFLLNRRQLWPFLALAFYIAGITASVLLGNRHFLAAFGYMTGNMVESISCAWLILYFAKDFQKFDRVKEVMLLIVGAVLLNAFSSCIGAFTTVLAGGASFGNSWWSWYISDGLGILLIGPLIVSWTNKPKKIFTGLHLKKIIEGVVFIIVWLIISYFIFYHSENNLLFGFHPYMLVALLVWPAIRMGMKGFTPALLIFFIVALFSPVIVNGPSPWGGPDTDMVGRLLELQMFIAFLAIVGYLVSAGYTSLTYSEKALRQSEEKFRKLFENSGTSIIIIGADGKYLMANDRAANQFGLPSNEIVGKSMLDLLPYQTAQKYFELNKTLIETGGSREYEDSFVLNGNNKVFLILDQVLQDKNGNNYAIQSSSIEITERKKTEKVLIEYMQLFSLFMKYSPVYTFIKEVTSTESRVLQASKNFREMTGIPGSEMIGKTMEQLFPPEFAAKISTDDWKVVSEGKILQQDEDLNGRNYTSIKFPIIMEGKNLLAGYTIDITERKQAEEELKQNEIRLKELVATKDKFFSIIAHDLKSPFNSILGFSEILIKKVQDKDLEAIEEYAAIIQKSSTKAMNLLLNLLDWSRSQTGKMEFSPEYVDITSLINGAIELINDSARQKSITISNECQQNVIAFADKAMIGTILRNLISNAIKFTHPGGKVVISAEQKKNKMKIAVIDNGIGIKKEDIGKLFHIGESYSSKGTQNEGGTGLGLMLCKEFIEKHRGKIRIESEPGKGSKFCFTIPNV